MTDRPVIPRLLEGTLPGYRLPACRPGLEVWEASAP
jgi:hypothetical protein